MPFISFEKKIDRWQTVIQRFKPEVSSIIGKITFDLYSNSQIVVPVRRPDVEKRTGITGGYLKSTGQPSFIPGALEGEVRYTAYYAGYVHEGTVKMPPRPFLRNEGEKLVPVMIAAFMQLEGRLL